MIVGNKGLVVLCMVLLMSITFMSSEVHAYDTGTFLNSMKYDIANHEDIMKTAPHDTICTTGKLGKVTCVQNEQYTEFITEQSNDDTFYGRSYTPYCLFECDLPMKLTYDGWFTPDSITPDENSITYSIAQKIGNVNISEITIEYLINESYLEKEWIPNEVCEEKDVNSTIQNVCTDEGYYNYTDAWRMVWSTTPPTINKGDEFYVNIHGKLKGHGSVDIVPEIFGQKLTELAWWDGNWLYKMPINVSTGTNLNNYQLGINVTFNGDGHMNADFSDLRVVNKTENGELNYWIEQKVDSTWAYVWFKGNFTTANDTQAYLYYGKPSATTTSNGKLVFPLFDDFDDASINATIWNTAGTVQETGGAAKVTGGWSELSSVDAYSTSSCAMGRIQFQNYGSDSAFSWSDTANIGGIFIGYQWGYPSAGLNSRIFGTGAGDYSWGTPSGYQYLSICRRDAGSTDYYTNHSTNKSILEGDAADLNVRFTTLNAVQYADWIAVRNYIQYEPTYVFDTELTGGNSTVFLYNANDVETNLSSFKIAYVGITDVSDMEGNIIYNGTVYHANKTVYAGNITLDANIIIPLISVNTTNAQFYWNYNVTFISTNSTTTYNSTNFNQTIAYGYYVVDYQKNASDRVEGSPFNTNFTIRKESTVSSIQPYFSFAGSNVSANITSTNSTNAVYFANGAFPTVSSGTDQFFPIVEWINVSYNGVWVQRGASDNITSYKMVMSEDCVTYPNILLNLSFADQLNPANLLNGTLNLMTITYYNGNVQRSATITNLTGAYWHRICGIPNDTIGTFKANISLQYGSSNSSYPLRNWANTSMDMNSSAIMNRTLYLLYTSSGQYVSFFTLQQALESPITQATVDIYSQISGIWTLLNSKQTDDSGSALFFLDPTSPIQVVAYKTGYTTSNFTISPSQTLYKIYLASTAGTNVSGGVFGNITYLRSPDTMTLLKDATHVMNYTVLSSDSKLQNYGMNLYYCNPTCANVFSDTQFNSAGGNITHNVTLANTSSGTLIMETFFLRTDYPLFSENRTYYISDYNITNPSNTSVSGILLSLYNSGDPLIDQQSFAIIVVLITICSMAFSAKAFGLGGGGMIGILVLGVMCVMGTYIYSGQSSGLFANAGTLWSAYTIIALGTLSFIFMKGGG